MKGIKQELEENQKRLLNADENQVLYFAIEGIDNAEAALGKYNSSNDFKAKVLDTLRDSLQTTRQRSNQLKSAYSIEEIKTKLDAAGQTLALLRPVFVSLPVSD